MAGLAKIHLKAFRSGPSLGKHPWVFESTIEKIEGHLEDGDEAEIHGGTDNRFVGYGLFNSRSQIRARIYSFDKNERLTKDFFKKRICAAKAYRKNFRELWEPEGGARLIFSEADGLSGLTVDRYGEFLSVQITSLAVWKRWELIRPLLEEEFKPLGLVLRGNIGMAKREGFEIPETQVFGEQPPELIHVHENDLDYSVKILGGQKTGFFLDQRDNRKVLREFASRKRVLDLCCYQGGFALNAAYAGAKEVIGVDSSREAIEAAEANAEQNDIKNAKFYCADIYEWLKDYGGENFDVIVLDPPRLAPSRADRHRALRTYFKMNQEAMKKLKAGGIYVSASCSAAISRSDFQQMLAGVSRREGRFYRLIEQRGPGRDHPVSLSCPETDYLKCFFGYVD